MQSCPPMSSTNAPDLAMHPRLTIFIYYLFYMCIYGYLYIEIYKYMYRYLGISIIYAQLLRCQAVWIGFHWNMCACTTAAKTLRGRLPILVPLIGKVSPSMCPGDSSLPSVLSAWYPYSSTNQAAPPRHGSPSWLLLVCAYLSTQNHHMHRALGPRTVCRAMRL